MNRKRMIKQAIKEIKKRRKNIQDYLNDNNNISYQFADIKLRHYIHNVMTSAKISGNQYHLYSEKFIYQYIKTEDLDLTFISPNEIRLDRITTNWHKYYELLIEDYDNILASFQAELINTKKTKWTPTDIVALIGGLSGLATTIINAIH